MKQNFDQQKDGRETVVKITTRVISKHFHCFLKPQAGILVFSKSSRQCTTILTAFTTYVGLATLNSYESYVSSIYFIRQIKINTGQYIVRINLNLLQNWRHKESLYYVNRFRDITDSAHQYRPLLIQCTGAIRIPYAPSLVNFIQHYLICLCNVVQIWKKSTLVREP